LDPKIRLVDNQIRPHVLKDPSSADDFAAAAHQQCENIEGTAPQLDPILAGEKKAPGRDQTKRSELKYFTFIGSFVHGSNLTFYPGSTV
jgi:hypothetical protein